MHIPEHLVDRDVLGGNPAHPRKVAEGLEEIPGEDVPNRRAGEGDVEEPLAAHAPTVTYSGVFLGMEGIEKPG